MNNQQIHNDLISKLNKENAFWSYDKFDINQISDEVFIANVLLHLDVDDILFLFKLYPKKMIRQIWKNEMLSQEPMYHGLNRLYAFLFFDIKNPDRYIRDFKNNRLKSILCKD
jgi:hypothetical protein